MKRMAGFLLYLAWAIQCGWGIAQHFRSVEMEHAGRLMSSLGLGADEWLAHLLATAGMQRSCWKTGWPGGCAFHDTNCSFLNLHVDVNYFHSKHLQHKPHKLLHKAIVVSTQKESFIFSYRKYDLKIVLPPEMTEFFPNGSAIFPLNDFSQYFISLPSLSFAHMGTKYP